MTAFGTDFTSLAREAHGRVLASPGDALERGLEGVSYWIVCSSPQRPPAPENVLCVAGETGDAIGEDGFGAGVGHGPPRALSVFSFREEAEAFSELQGRGPGLRVREFEGGELISLLYGLWGGFTRVALDPMPEAEHHAAHGLVIVSREEFVKLLVSRATRPSPPPAG